jgi:hypothetical protein
MIHHSITLTLLLRTLGELRQYVVDWMIPG